MPTQTIGTEDAPEGATVAPQPPLPDWLAQLIDPRVMAEQNEKVQKKVADNAETTVHRRRCAKVVADHLLEEFTND